LLNLSNSNTPEPSPSSSSCFRNKLIMQTNDDNNLLGFWSNPGWLAGCLPAWLLLQGVLSEIAAKKWYKLPSLGRDQINPSLAQPYRGKKNTVRKRQDYCAIENRKHKERDDAKAEAIAARELESWNRHKTKGKDNKHKSKMLYTTSAKCKTTSNCGP
jgi:hypothetical protein